MIKRSRADHRPSRRRTSSRRSASIEVWPRLSRCVRHLSIVARWMLRAAVNPTPQRPRSVRLILGRQRRHHGQRASLPHLVRLRRIRLRPKRQLHQQAQQPYQSQLFHDLLNHPDSPVGRVCRRAPIARRRARNTIRPRSPALKYNYERIRGVASIARPDHADPSPCHLRHSLRAAHRDGSLHGTILPESSSQAHQQSETRQLRFITFGRPELLHRCYRPCCTSRPMRQTRVRRCNTLLASFPSIRSHDGMGSMGPSEVANAPRVCQHPGLQAYRPCLGFPKTLSAAPR